MTHRRPAAPAAILAATLAALAPAAAHADAAPADTGLTFSPMAGFAFTNGGERLVRVIIVNADDGSYMGSTAVKAGGQDYLYAGGELRFPGRRFALQGTIGYHWDSKGGNDVDVTFSRTPIELVGLWQPVHWLRVGGGVRYDMRVRMSGKGNASAPEYQAEFANAFGPVLKAEFMIQPDTGLVLRWSKVDYKLRKVGGEDASSADYTADGRSFGVGLDLHF